MKFMLTIMIIGTLIDFRWLYRGLRS